MFNSLIYYYPLLVNRLLSKEQQKDTTCWQKYKLFLLGCNFLELLFQLLSSLGVATNMTINPSALLVVKGEPDCTSHQSSTVQDMVGMSRETWRITSDMMSVTTFAEGKHPKNPYLWWDFIGLLWVFLYPEMNDLVSDNPGRPGSKSSFPQSS